MGITGLGLLLGSVCGMLEGAPVPQQVRFGDLASESLHAAVCLLAPAQIGALREPCRRLEPGGYVAFTLACDRAFQNYLTVKFWGSDTEVATLFLFDGDRRIGSYGSSEPELDLGEGGAAFPGRFYYTTYSIPPALTKGRITPVVGRIPVATATWARNCRPIMHPMPPQSSAPNWLPHV